MYNLKKLELIPTQLDNKNWKVFCGDLNIANISNVGNRFFIDIKSKLPFELSDCKKYNSLNDAFDEIKRVVEKFLLIFLEFNPVKEQIFKSKWVDCYELNDDFCDIVVSRIINKDKSYLISQGNEFEFYLYEEDYLGCRSTRLGAFESLESAKEFIY